MKVLIVEDEPRAARRLARLISRIDPEAEVIATLGSVADSVAWFGQHPQPDLVFLDVRLGDGNCFEILDQVDMQSPIVFCTAYSEYALRAFAVNSIDYLLKPLVAKDLQRALAKYKRLAGYRMAPEAWPDFTREATPPHYQQQFLVALGGRFVPVRVEEVVAARSYLKSVQLLDRDGREWLLDQPLIDVEACLDPKLFTRLSRQWLVRVSAISELTRGPDGYAVSLPPLETALKVSRARVAALKQRMRHLD